MTLILSDKKPENFTCVKTVRTLLRRKCSVASITKASINSLVKKVCMAKGLTSFGS